MASVLLALPVSFLIARMVNAGASRPLDSSQLTVGYDLFQSLGCYIDSGPRTLPTQLNIGPVTLETCGLACLAQGFSYFGTEYSQECWCGNSIGGNGAPAPAGDCSMLCNGDHTELCGGPNRLNLYQFVGQQLNATDPCRPEQGKPFDVFIRPKNVSYTDGTNFHQLVSYTSGPQTFYIISACVDGCNVNGQNFYVRNRQLYANGTDLNGLPFYAESLPLVMGETPMMVSTAPGNPPLYNEYCFSVQSETQLSSLGLFWTWLEVQNSKEFWYTCPNNTADGRPDIVYAAYKNHPHYTFSECTPIYVQADYSGSF
ncbi:WSC-domain-containing protein [Pluteus cervinus]|uniref:WSC-domain-containing protein n=1 Tax=Pluteus cervinus TaxID=181527 RepID=A0ACD3B3P9_9AGAR|nr:WSC-domain-containing protein [Pluteus cervinus]